MYDPIYGGSDDSIPEFKICLVCGETNCEAHKDHPLMDEKPAQPYSEGFMRPLSPVEILHLFGESFGVSVPTDAEKDAEEGEDVLLHTGEKEELVQFEDGDFEPAIDKHGPRITGGKIFTRDSSKDKEAGEDGAKICSYLDMIGTEEVITGAGVARRIRLYRARQRDNEKYKAIEEAAMTLVPKLRQRIHLALEAEARLSRERGLKRGTVDTGRAAQLVASGASDIFAKKATRRDVKTAVTLLLDDSSSMQAIVGHGPMITRWGERASRMEFMKMKAGCAAVLSFALAEVFKQLGITFELISYQASHRDTHWPNHYSILYKGFSEPWDAVKKRMGSYNPTAGTDLPTDGCTFAAKRLLKRTEDRRILIYLTDGEDAAYDAGLYPLAQELERKAHTKLIGIGICVDHMKNSLKEKCEVVNKMDDLNDVVFGKIAKLIHPC